MTLSIICRFKLILLAALLNTVGFIINILVSVPVSLLSGDERPSEPLEAGSPAGSGSVVPLCHLPSLLHLLWADVRP